MALLVPGAAARGQGLTVTPSLGLFGLYDDNVFARAGVRDGTSMFRAMPSVRATYEPGPRTTMLLSLGSSAELFPEFPEENRLLATQRGALGLEMRPGSSTTASLGVSYVRSQDPGEVLEMADLAFRRGTAQAVSARAGLSHRLGPGDSMQVSYAFRDAAVRDPLVAAEYGGESHTLRLGWTHELGPRTTINLEGGPRYSANALRAHVSVALSHRMERTSLNLGYSRGRSTVPSEHREIESERFTVGASRRLGQAVQAGVNASHARHLGVAGLRRTYQVGGDLSWAFSAWGSALVGYRRLVQDGELGFTVADTRPGMVVHNTVTAGVVLSRGYRLR